MIVEILRGVYVLIAVKTSTRDKTTGLLNKFPNE